MTKKDILAFVESGGARRLRPPQLRRRPQLRRPQLPRPPRRRSPPQPPLRSRAGETLPGETLEPITAMRRGIAEHMRRSLDTGAHVTSAIEVDFSRIVAAREKLKKEYQAAYGVNPTYLAFVAKATVETLRDYPYVNAEMRGDSIVTRNFVNLGIAVELAEGKGLIVPVIRNAEGLNLLGLAKRHRRHREQGAQQAARAGRRPGRHVHDHEPRRLRHVPRHAGDQPAAVGDPRHVRARRSGRGSIEDELGKDVIAIRPMMNITLTYDHRLVDGAYAGRFLRDLRERLEGWEGDGG